jgi:E3 ubiquitin-protein ligase MYLIP
MDYFGLRYEGPKGEILWLNMRNKISKQLRHAAWKTAGVRQYKCYRLQLHVKFFVPIHMLLQDTTKYVCTFRYLFNRFN